MNGSDSVLAGSMRDRLRDIQHEILEATASGRPLPSVMDKLCRRIEGLDPSIICSVLQVDGEGFLHSVAAPSLPAHYCAAIDTLQVGPCVGSCGTAAYRGETVIVTDIENDPLWLHYKSLALPLGLRACWSSPIKARDGRVVGTFAFYYRCVRAPNDFERSIVSTCVHLCAIAIEQEEARAKIHQLAFYDSVTGLPNRVLFQQRASEILADPASAAGVVRAVHYLDLDDFKSVNDTLGHHFGDALLKEVGARLTWCAGEGDLVARLGGDEFALVQTTARHKGEVRSFAGQLIEAVSQPFDLFGQTVAVRGSIGFTIPGDQADLDVLMRQADLAAYEAKRDGGGCYRMFQPPMFKRALDKRNIEQDLRRADVDREFRLVYQPVMSLQTGEIVGGEALVRWDHPERGPVPPSDFIPIAEQCGFMRRLGDWILRTACHDAARWPAHLMLSVNISPVQFRHSGFALNVVRVLKDAALSPHRLQFEITETALTGDANAVRVILQQFSNMHIRIALDDFGTGYSSLSHLRTFPIDTIKIDRSFVREFAGSAGSTAIVKAVLNLARDLGMSTTAEGIETPDQAADLATAGCTHAQGFYLGRPMARDDFEAFIGAAQRPMPRNVSSR